MTTENTPEISAARRVLPPAVAILLGIVLGVVHMMGGWFLEGSYLSPWWAMFTVYPALIAGSAICAAVLRGTRAGSWSLFALLFFGAAEAGVIGTIITMLSHVH